MRRATLMLAAAAAVLAGRGAAALGAPAARGLRVQQRALPRLFCAGQAPSGEKTEEEKARLKAERDARKAAKQAAKEAKKAKKAAMAAAAEPPPLASIGIMDAELQDSQRCGDYVTIQSQGITGREYTDMAELTGDMAGQKVWIRARLQNVRAKGGSAFLVLRQGAFNTLQALFFKDKEQPEMSKRMLKYLGGLSAESVVDIYGELVSADVKSCSINSLELSIEKAFMVSAADAMLPFQHEDAARPLAEVEESQGTERPFPRIGQELRLDNRWLDVRTPANNAIMRIRSGICRFYRESLYSHGFVEIQTPKLIGGESEGGSEVFRTDYFGKPACLAQSPQLYKQMAISGDLGRVFEVGPVFRAEQSHTRRHLCEFTGLDMEMQINEHYSEVFPIVHDTFKRIFHGLEEHYADEIAAVREQYPQEPAVISDEPCVIKFPDGMQMLRDAGVEDVDDFGDLTGAQELELGRLVKEKFGTDFFILADYPSAVRPFYTMPNPEDDRYSNSYDMFIRGQEICSGAQRVHDPELLRKIILSKGLELDKFEDYIKSFEHGCAPHAGGGFGLERVVFLYLGLDNVRKAVMFPRDPNRLSP
uniref:aspartate--tRNA ligase n=1 Tax=Phaeomonas parva TaxID=124430 RepID=A0A7S1UCM0_9STRA|mmetsp:Transcript_41595/g.130342  ORF Transcript_41595/g.130342 Transcript_41595/m.130342 type:complete len:591 (+) Transcript_41595:28-1800(+)